MGATNTFGERIKKLRLDLGLTQEEVAAAVGYKSRSSINKVEIGFNEVSQSRVMMFARALRTNPAYLIGLSDDPSSISVLENDKFCRQELLELYESLPRHAREDLIDKVRDFCINYKE